MKKLNRKEEFERMQKMYQNDKGVHEYMDLVTFAWNYYNEQVKKFEELRNFWTYKEINSYLNNTPKKVKVIIKKH